MKKDLANWMNKYKNQFISSDIINKLKNINVPYNER